MPCRSPRGRAFRGFAVALAAGLTTLLLLSGPVTGARASAGLTSIIQDDQSLARDTLGTLHQMRALGAEQVRVPVRWQTLAPAPNSFRAPKRFNASDPAAYAPRLWAPYDQIVRDAAAEGIQVDLNLIGGAPLWATGPGMPRIKGYPFHQWEPSAPAFKAFVEAVARRYSGNYDPRTRRFAPGNPDDLPRVTFWSIWNEPDYGPSLAPQAVPRHANVEEAPRLYRQLVDAAWSALHATGHGRDDFIWGELAPRGTLTFGNFNGMTPLVFLRALYCVDARYRPLRGSAATLRGCPTTVAGSRRFARQNPALFQASGVSDHPYMRWYPPNREEAAQQPAHFSQILPNYTTLATIGHLETALNRLTRVYGSHKVFPIWNTEFGYITSPPKRIWKGNKAPYVSPATAAYYDNWAEYISWKNPRIASFEQYLLADPLPATKAFNYGGFASGLLFYGGRPKPGYGAWRMPLFLPKTTASSPNQSLEVWGAARPIHYALMDDPGAAQSVTILFKPDGGSFSVLDTIPVTSPQGYFDTHIAFPTSGTVVAEWTYPVYSLSGTPGAAVFSRQVHVTVR